MKTKMNKNEIKKVKMNTENKRNAIERKNKQNALNVSPEIETKGYRMLNTKMNKS